MQTNSLSFRSEFTIFTQSISIQVQIHVISNRDLSLLRHQCFLLFVIWYFKLSEFFTLQFTS